MAHEPAGFSITSRTISVGDAVIATERVARVALGPRPDLRRQSGYMLSAACAAGVLAAVAFSMGHTAPLAVLGLAAAVTMLIGLIWRRGVALYIVTDDSSTTVLLHDDDAFSRQVLGVVSEIMAAGPSAQLAYYVDVDAQRVEPTAIQAGVASGRPRSQPQQPAGQVNGLPNDPAANSNRVGGTAPTYGPGAATSASDAIEPSRRPAADTLPPSQRPGPREPAVDEAQDWFGTSPSSDRAGGGDISPATRPSQRAAGPHPTGVGQPPVDPQPAPGLLRPPVRNAVNGQSPPSGNSDAVVAFDDMMARIAPQYGDRFDDVRQWLGPVRAYLARGEGQLAEAQSRWSIFTQEHLPALSRIASVNELAGRIGRGIGVAV